MGLGKSLQALFYCWKKRRFPVLVICPASLKYNWEREAATHLSLMSEVLSGRRVSRLKPLTTHPVVIVNYEILEAWLPYIQRLDIQCVLVDEAHYIKNRESQRYQLVRELCRDIRHVIGISGTPLTNRPVELWPILSILLPEIYTGFLEFAFFYSKPVRRPWGWQYTGARNLDQLHADLVRQCMIRRLKKDVLHELPDKVRRVVPLELPNRKEYVKAKENFLEWLQQEHGSIRARSAKKAEALVKLGYLLRLCARLKVDLVLDWIDNYLEGTEEKLVLFTMHRRMVELLHERYKKLSVVLDGSTKPKDRQVAVDRFQHDRRVRLFIGNIRAAGVGITLTKAPTCVFTDLPWTPGDLTQGEDRIHRIGQMKTATIYYLVAVNTVEEKLCKLLRDKQEVLANILDGKDNGDDLDIFAELIKNL